MHRYEKCPKKMPVFNDFREVCTIIKEAILIAIISIFIEDITTFYWYFNFLSAI